MRNIDIIDMNDIIVFKEKYIYDSKVFQYLFS